MKNLIPNNAKLGKGCIKNFERNPTNYPDNTPKNPSDKSLEEKVYEQTIEELKRNFNTLRLEYSRKKQHFIDEKSYGRGSYIKTGSFMKDISLREENLEAEFFEKCEQSTLDLIRNDNYWSSNLDSYYDKYLCAPFHLVLAIGTSNFSRNRVPPLDHDAMKKLTRHWACCQPKRTLIIAPMQKKQYVQSYWKDWLSTYKLWGGGMEFFDVNIQMMGLNVSVGEVSNIL